MSKKFEGADGIRGLACLIVLCVHAIAMFYPATFPALVGMGKVGVWLFFVLSAFLLTAKFESSGYSFRSLFNYAIGRFLRIIPIFFIACLLYYSTGLIGIVSQADLYGAVTLSSGYGHLWTIPVEFKFYSILPVLAFLLFLTRDRVGYLGVCVLSVAMIGLQQYLWPYYLTPESSTSTHWYLSCFTLGCLTYVFFDAIRVRVTGNVSTIVGIAAMLSIALFSPILRSKIFGIELDRWAMNKHFFIGAIWSVFLLVMMDGKGAIGRLLKSRFMVAMGRYSFSIYLVHLLIYIEMTSYLQDSFLLNRPGFPRHSPSSGNSVSQTPLAIAA